jgi:hypothetical protein
MDDDHQPTIDELERDIATIAAETRRATNGSGTHVVPTDVTPTADPVTERIGRIAELNGQAIRETSESAARRCLDAGQAAVDVARELEKQATELATAIRKHGATMAQNIDDFAAMATRVAASMRSTRQDVFGPDVQRYPGGETRG